jgi:hypothetical protein
MPAIHLHKKKYHTNKENKMKVSSTKTFEQQWTETLQFLGVIRDADDVTRNKFKAVCKIVWQQSQFTKENKNIKELN